MLKLQIFAHGKLYLLLLVYLLLTTAYNLSLPLIKSDDDDENAHFRYIRFIAMDHHLPASWQERQAAGYRARDGYPPFYHAIAGLLLSWVDGKDIVFWWDQSEFSVLPRESMPQQIDVGDTITVFQTAFMDNFHQGFVLLWHLSRLFSSLLGVGTLMITYFTALELFPGKKVMALVAAATVAFIPRFVLISANASDDNMLALLMAIYLFLMVKVIKGNDHPFIFAAIGITLGLSIVTKFSVAFIPLTTVLFLGFLAWRRGWGRGVLVKRVAITAMVAILASSWWFAFVVWNFNEIETRGLVSGVFNALVPDVASNLSGADLINAIGGNETAVKKKGNDSYADWIVFFSKSFFEFRLRMFPGEFPVLAQISGLAALGVVLAIIAIGLIKTWRYGDEFQRMWLGLFVLHLLALFPLMLIRHYFNGAAPETAQGRHVLMSSASAVGIMLAVGWCYWARTRPFNWLKPVLPGILLLWSVTQLYWIHHYFPKLAPISAEAATRYRVPTVEVLLNQPVVEGVNLVGYSAQAQPNAGTLAVTVVWSAASQPAQNDYLTEIELSDSTGRPVSGWVGHPADGMYPTRAWGTGDIIYDQVELPIHNLLPGKYTLKVYLLNGYERPVRRVTKALFVREITITDPVSGLSVYKHVEIQTEAGLVGIKYQIWPFEFFNFSPPLYRYRAVVAVAWEPDKPLADNQTLKLQLIAANGQTFAPVNESGGVKNFIVAGDWPPGLYQLKAQVFEAGRVVGESVTLPVLQVENEARSFVPPPMHRQVNANFYNKITLLGYDVSNTRLKPGEVLSMKTYWQSRQIINQKLRMFAYLSDGNNQVWLPEKHPSPPYRGGTIVWTPGQVVTDETKIWLDPRLPNGIYQIHLGLFVDLGENKQLRLPLVDGDKITNVTQTTLGLIKVGGSSPQVLAGEVKPQHKRDDTLGNVIKLVGYDLRNETARLHLTLYWESVGITNLDYTTFVHVRNKMGQMIAQKDNPPAEGKYPTSLWDVGEVIRDEYVLSLPDNSTGEQYEVAVGLYNPVSKERLTLTGSADDTIPLTILDTATQQ